LTQFQSSFSDSGKYSKASGQFFIEKDKLLGGKQVIIAKTNNEIQNN